MAVTRDCLGVDQFFGGSCWGVENLTVGERHYKAIEAGVDQFGGNNEIGPVLEAYQLGVQECGEAYMREKFQQSAKRLLRNMFQVGLFENPYLDSEESEKIVGNPKFMKKGYQAQLETVILLKNKNNLLPLKSRKKVYIPERFINETKNWFGDIVPAHKKMPVNLSLMENYFDVVKNPSDADFAFAFIESPQSIGYSKEDKEAGGNGYLPISLQYKPYKAIASREEALAGTDRSYKNKENVVSNQNDLTIILDLKKENPDLPIVVSIQMNNPTIVSEFEPVVDAILVDFGIQTQAMLDIVTGKFEPRGLLPFQMPKDMETVELQAEDVPLDMECYQDELGNIYDFGFGMNFSGRIQDERVSHFYFIKGEE